MQADRKIRLEFEHRQEQHEADGNECRDLRMIVHDELGCRAHQPVETPVGHHLAEGHAAVDESNQEGPCRVVDARHSGEDGTHAHAADSEIL